MYKKNFYIVAEEKLFHYIHLEKGDVFWVVDFEETGKNKTIKLHLVCNTVRHSRISIYSFTQGKEEGLFILYKSEDFLKEL